MPLGSIAEWRACIGSSWCALGRPFKTRSPFRHAGAGRLQTPLTLNQVVTMIMILMIFTAINLAIRIIWTTGHYRAYLGKSWENSKYYQKLTMAEIHHYIFYSGLIASCTLHSLKIIGLLLFQSLHCIITSGALPWLLGTLSLRIILG